MSQTQVVAFKGQASGASVASGVYTITSGYTTIYQILVYPISGGPPNTSSGLTIQVVDAISGMGNTNSGILVWSLGFGSQSGVGSSAMEAEPLTGVQIPCNSGVVVQTVAGWVTEVIYAK